MELDRTQESEGTATRPAIVLGGQVNGLGAARSLGRLGVPVGLIAISTAGDHARYSRYVRSFKYVASPFGDDEIRVALDEVRRALPGDSPVLIPTADRFSRFISRNQSILSSEYSLNCADQQTYESFLDKWRTAEICTRHGVLFPRTECPCAESELRQLAETFTYPVIVKPRYTFDTSFPGKNATISSGADLIAFFEKNDILENAVIQEVIPSGDGDILVIASYSDFNGTVMAMYSGRKIRQHLPDYGATCFGISETYPDLRERTRLFLEAISYRGFAMTEFARSRVDGQAYFLELNTRTSWTNQLYSDAGIDLTQIAYRDILGNTRDLEVQNPAQIDNVVWLDFRRDVSSMLLKRKTGQITVLGWLRSLAQATSFAHWDWRDPIPFLAACGWRIRNTVGRLVELAVDKPTWKSRK